MTSEKFPIPMFLQAGRAQALNYKLIDKTGCFAFLKTDIGVPFKAPTAYHDAFIVYTVSLYSLYHDYGCKILELVLDSSLTPSSMDPRSLASVRRHIDDILKHLRPNVAHGIYETERRITLQKKIATYYLKMDGTDLSTDQWPDFINTLSDTNWKVITLQLVHDSDSLYCYLEQWADAWALEKDEEKQALREKFAKSDFFKLSFGQSLYEPLYTAIFKLYKPADDPKTFYKTRIKGKRKITEWHDELSRYFLHNAVCGPDALYKLLAELITKEILRPVASSVDIAKKYGF